MQQFVPDQFASRKRNGSYNNNDSGYNKRPRQWTAAANQTTLESVVDFVFNLPSLQDVEVKFKVGRITVAGFLPMLQEQDYNKILAFVKNKISKTTNCTHYICADKVEVLERDQLVMGAAIKDTHLTLDMPTNLNFDFRAAVMSNTKCQMPLDPPSEYLKKEIRESAWIEADNWSTAVTFIRTSSPAYDEEIRAYEVEVELKTSSIRACSDKVATTVLLEKAFGEVHHLMSKLAKPGPQNFPELRLEKVFRSGHAGYLKREFFRFIPPTDRPRLGGFPGSMPSGLSRTKLRLIQARDYWVSEKSDGVRYLLFVLDRSIFLVDRKMDFWQIHGYWMLGELYGQQGPTILDGEMVRHRVTGRPMFMVFDILSLKGEISCAMMNLTKRIALIGTGVVNTWRSAVGNHEDKVPFKIIGKIFHAKKDISKLLGAIKHVNGKHTYEDHKRNHGNDGLIFTPDVPYIPYTSTNIMKWKYADKLTIDFKITITDTSRTAWVWDLEDVEWQDFEMSERDWTKLAEDMSRQNNTGEAIVECLFEFSTNKWRYITIRTDKDSSNHRKTAMDTVSLLKQDISLKEIEYRVKLSPANDDWDFRTDMSPRNVRPAVTGGLSSQSSPGMDLPSTPLPSPLPYTKTTSPNMGPPDGSPSPITSSPSLVSSSPSASTLES